MNEKQATDAAYLLYVQVKTAVAILLLKAKPEGMNIREFVVSFQHKVRKKTNRCNLYLEKQIFRNQFVFLLPEIKVHWDDHQFMENDGESRHLFDDCMIPALANVDGVASKTMVQTATVLRKIKSISGFVDTIQKIKLLSEESRDIVLTDLIRILSYSSEGPNDNSTECAPKKDLIVSGSLFHYLINSVDAGRIITQGSLEIISLIEIYLDEEREMQVTDEALRVIQCANNVIFESVSLFPSTTECCKQTIGSFLRKTLRNLSITQKITGNHTACSNWYSVFGVWRKEEFTCVEMINTLIMTLKDVEDDSYLSVAHSYVSLSECNLLLLKKLLISYHKMYISDTAQPNDSDIDQWEETLRATIADSHPKHSNTLRLARHCLKLVISFKSYLKT